MSMMEIDSILDIDARGDIILAVGSIKYDVTEDFTRPVQHLRVSSAVLRLASAVFTVLLGSHFREGRTLSGTSTVEIALPEDDAQAMQSLCQMLHLQHNQVSPTAVELLEIAKVSDKYDCTNAIIPMVDCWLGQLYKESSKLKHKRRLLIAALLFRRPAFFADVGRELLLKAKSKKAFSVPKLCEDHHREQLGCVFAALIEAREDKITRINQFVEGELAYATATNTSSGACMESCKFRHAYWAKFLESLRMAQAWPSLGLEGSTLLNYCSRLRNVEWRIPKDEAIGKASCGKHCFMKSIEVFSAEVAKARFDSAAEEAERSLPDLCLDCARAGFGLKQEDCAH